MADKQIRIYPERREIDAVRLAKALLSLASHLSPEDKARFVAEGKRVRRTILGGVKQKGSAA